jgi:hypothetical protein
MRLARRDAAAGHAVPQPAVRARLRAAALVAMPVGVVIAAILTPPVGEVASTVLTPPVGEVASTVVSTSVGQMAAAVMPTPGAGALLPVVALLVDMARGARLVAIELRTLARRHDAIGACPMLQAPDPALLAPQPGGFTTGQLTRLDTVMDARALACLTRIDTIAARRRPIAFHPRQRISTLHSGISTAFTHVAASSGALALVASITLLGLRETTGERRRECQRNDDSLHGRLLGHAARPDAVRRRDQCAGARHGQLCEMVTSLFPDRRACKRV